MYIPYLVYAIFVHVVGSKVNKFKNKDITKWKRELSWTLNLYKAMTWFLGMFKYILILILAIRKSHDL